MADLVFELGCEELPASAVRRASQQLADDVAKRLEEAALAHGEVTVMGTPRRLILSIAAISDRQEDTTKKQRGPSLSAAFDAAGEPTGALRGFCKSQGIEPSELEKEGEYVWVTKTISGRTASAVLAEAIPAAVRSLSFDKTMRWGSSRMRFSRPIRWMVAILGSEVLDFDIEGVKAGRESRGHRFLSPDVFEVADFASLVEGLRRRFVEPDASIRESLIRRQAEEISGGLAQLTDALVDENVFLTEWPQCLLGDFPAEYLELPRPVLITAMAKHEKMFPVQNEAGELLNQFVWVRNSGEEETVRRGNQWVLNARFNDAKFFYDEDARFSLDDFLARTEQMTFQEKLGSVRQRAERLSALAAFVAEETSATLEEVEWAREAGLYAKADLSSGLVGELASLQGIVGGDYARREGRPEAVCHAIASQYDLSLNPSPTSAESRTALRLVIADQLDKLVGFLGIGQVPSGSSDPFALRRAATILIDTAWSWPGIPSYHRMFLKAIELYQSQQISIDDQGIPQNLRAIFEQRLEALLAPRRYDVIAASLSAARYRPRVNRVCADALALISEDSDLISTLSRPLNILAAAEKKGIEPDADALASALKESVELSLDQQTSATEAALIEAIKLERPEELASALRSLAPAINAFFDTIMVMVEDEAVRNARLGLLARVRDVINRIGDVTKLVPDEAR